MTSVRQLVRNSIWNFAGLSLPLAAALAAIPLLIAALGKERFGVLALAWMFIGYFSLFDLGLGRALTKAISDHLGRGTPEHLGAMIRTALLLMLGLGLIGALIAGALTPWIVDKVLAVPAELKGETLQAFYLLALSIPVVILTSGLRGILEAYQKFAGINIVRMALGVFGFVGPLPVLPLSHSLVPVVVVLFFGRLVGLAVHFYLCRDISGSFVGRRHFDKTLVRPLLNLGKWMTVSNIVGPLMAYLDRFLIGSVVSMAAVAYYVTPYEIVTKLALIPGALAGVLFPAFAAGLSSDRARAGQLYFAGLKILFIILFPLCLAVVTFAHDGLRLWLGSDFADHSAAVLQWLTAGVLLNCLAQLPFALIQGAGRADWTAKLHLFELPLYLGALWVALHDYGILGAAIAWTVRAALDAVILLWLGRQIFSGTLGPPGMGVTAGFALATAAFLAGAALVEPWCKLVFVAVAVALFLAGSWKFALKQMERQTLVQLMDKPLA